MFSEKIYKEVDSAIKRVWLEDIKKDYLQHSLLKEDSLKNAFYYHLRRRLGDHYLLDNHLRIYTEFYYMGLRADLVVVKLNENPGQNGHLKNDVAEIIAAIEMKYKYDLSDKPFLSDIEKIRKSIEEYKINALYYLAFIHEVEYEANSTLSWIDIEKSPWAKGRVVELNGYFVTEKQDPVWEVVSYNGLNEDIFRGGNYGNEERKDNPAFSVSSIRETF
jgi:hypothetical protein